MIPADKIQNILGVLPSCDACPLETKNQRQVVPPMGNRQALIALVGEGPGNVEERYGKPFIGPAGKQLDWLLRQADMPPRGALWISNAALCKPRRVDYEDLGGSVWTKADTLRISTQFNCKTRLHSELAQVRPRVVLAVGNYALESLTTQTGITKRHGALIPAKFGQHQTIVVPMLHPAALLRNPKDTYAVIEVLKKAHRIANSGPNHPRTIVQISPFHPQGPDAALALLDEAVDAAIAAGDDIAIDVETTSEHPRTAALTIFGFATSAAAYPVTILAWNRQTQSFEQCWTDAQIARRDAIISRLVASRLRKWFWNYGFDVTICERYYPAVRGPYVDGMHYHWLIQPEMAHNLAFAAQSWLDIPPWKAAFWEAQDAGEATHTDLSVYNGDDCLNTIRLKPHLERELYKRGNAHLLDHQMRVSELARRAELCGVPVCKQTTYQLKEELLQKQKVELDKMIVAIRPFECAMSRSVWEQKCRERRRKANKLGRPYVKPPFEALKAEDFNPNSPHQARWFLFEHLELQPSRWTPGGVDKDNKQLSHSYKGVLGYLSKPLVEAYVNYGEYDYKLRLIRQVEKNGEDDPRYPGWWRLFVSWRTEGQKGTRWSSKIVNMQNWNKKMRKLLRAVPGRVWVGADAAQIEYRIAAALAGLDELVEIFNQTPFDEEAEPWKKYLGKYDAHSMIAEEVYGDEFTVPAAKYARTHDKKDMAGIAACRTLVKRVVYALFYGAHPPKILQSLREDRRLSPKLRATLTEERIAKIWEGFKKRFPAWDQWAEREMHYAQTRSYQEIPPMRRRRYWTQPTVEENKIRNTPIQLAAGDVCNVIFLNIQDRIDSEGLDAQMTIHGHDALYLDVSEAHAQRVKQIVNEEFHFDFPGCRQNVHIYGQASIGPTVADVG